MTKKKETLFLEPQIVYAKNLSQDKFYVIIAMTNFRLQTQTSNVITLLYVLTEFYLLLILSHQMRS